MKVANSLVAVEEIGAPEKLTVVRMEKLSEPEHQVKPKIFFPNLDAIRFIAASMVVIWHVEEHKDDYSFRSFKLPDLGHVGVSIFLVLSGFLITYLLMVEKNNTSTINFKQFYLRRILRIWPLYFAVLFFGYFIYPGISTAGLITSTFFLSNFAILLGLLPNVVDPIWSLGVEEQFYLVQPHFLRIKNPRTILIVLISLIVAYNALKWILTLFPATPKLQMINYGLHLFRYDCLLIGSVAGLLFFNEEHKLFNIGFSIKSLLSSSVRWACLAAIIVFIMFKLQFPKLLFNNLLAVIMAIFTINLCGPSTSMPFLRYKFFQYLGKISYGIYLLHKFCLFLILILLNRYFSMSDGLLANLTIYGFTFIVSGILAHFSYQYFEKPFLRIKSKFSKIRSH